MAFTDDAVLAKLSALNETQESIVTVAQWVLFHKRHAERTAQLWTQRVKDSGANKKLNLIYLANEVVQQSKARRKDDFLIAFSPVIAEAVATAYRGATTEVQQKIRRVVEVWRQRQIFEQPIQEAVENRIDELDKSRSSGKRSLLGGSFLSSSSSAIPPELQPLVSLQTAVSKISTGRVTAVKSAEQEYDKLNDPNTPTPSAPVHAARLSGLLKSLASAEGAVAESIKARRALIEGLEKILFNNRASLSKEESQRAMLTERKAEIEGRKRDVEDGIMRGLAEESSTPNHASSDDAESRRNQSVSAEPEAPAPEELSPPSVEALTPTGSPPPQAAPTIESGQEAANAEQPVPEGPFAMPVPELPQASINADLSSTLAILKGQAATAGATSNGATDGKEHDTHDGSNASKKRKLNHGPDGDGLVGTGLQNNGTHEAARSEVDDMAGAFGTEENGDDAMEELDDEVAAILRSEAEGSAFRNR